MEPFGIKTSPGVYSFQFLTQTPIASDISLKAFFVSEGRELREENWASEKT